MRARGLVASLVTVSIGALLGAPNAGAGNYRVHTCWNSDWSRPLGAMLAPTSPSGWSVIYGSGFPGVEVHDECQWDGGGLVARVREAPDVSEGSRFTLRWSVPDAAVLTGMSMDFLFQSDLYAGLGQGTVRATIETDREALFRADSAFAEAYGMTNDSPPFSRKVADAKRFDVVFTCATGPCRTSGKGLMMAVIARASFDVRDDSAPIGAVSGPAVAGSVWSGMTGVAVDGSDSGSGLSRGVIEVDGSDAQSVQLADDRGTCSDVGPDPTVREYAAAKPCPGLVHGQFNIDTAALPQGEHTVRILLEDASGNRTAVFGPVTRRIDANNTQIGPGSDPARRGALNGDKASDDGRMAAHWGVRGRKSLLKSGYGRRHVVTGRLTTALGEPISGATLDVVSKTTAVNARELAKGGPQTGSDGNFSMVLPRGVSSRDLTLRYRSHVADTIPVAAASLRLRVRAGVRLTVTPRRAVRGQVVRFHGRLLGGPIPRGGKQLVMTVRGQTGGWLRFNVVRTDSRGRFSLGYRFKQPGAARYRFRALSLAEAAYPYLAGGSNVASVRKR